MVWIDYAIIGIVGFSALISLVRGFVKEAMSLVTWFVAFFIAISIPISPSISPPSPTRWFATVWPSRRCLWRP